MIVWISEILETVLANSQSVFHLSPAVIAGIGLVLAIVKVQSVPSEATCHQG